MTDKKYKYWLAVVDGELVQFSELPHMIATALDPENGTDYACHRLNLEDELKKAVRDGLLRVRNPVGLGFHTLTHGNALQRAVLIPDTDLEPFLNEKGIELRITPHGNGPEYWTLENAAAAMQEQLNWHDGTRAEFQDKMQEAAKSSALVILDPRTCLPPIRIESVHTYWEYVTPDSVNAWLATLKAPYRWSSAPPLVKVTHESTTTPAVVANAGPLPLTTGDIAFCFAGLRWDEQQWKKPLGDKPKWLAACIVIPGVRGVSETRWNPVCIGAALERGGHVKANSIRAKFQTKPLLMPWLDEWKTYEADYLDTK